jgi:hypothetical protein
MTRILCVFFQSLLAVPLLVSQPSTTEAPPNPCARAQQKQLDFWVGEWENLARTKSW